MMLWLGICGMIIHLRLRKKIKRFWGRFLPSSIIILLIKSLESPLFHINNSWLLCSSSQNMESFSFDWLIHTYHSLKEMELGTMSVFSGWFTSVKSCCWKKTQRALKHRRNQGSFPTPEVNRVNCRPLKVGSVHLVFGSSTLLLGCQSYCSGWGHIKSPKHWQSLRALDHLRLKIASPYPKSTGWRLKTALLKANTPQFRAISVSRGGPSVTTSRCCNGGVCVVHLNRHLSYSGTRPTQTLQPSKLSQWEKCFVPVKLTICEGWFQKFWSQLEYCLQKDTFPQRNSFHVRSKRFW